MPTPFVNEEFTFTNPDGSTIRVRGSGNQYYAVFETLDGYTVVKNPDNGFYTYAQLSEDKSQLIATDGIVGQVAPQSLGIQNGGLAGDDAGFLHPLDAVPHGCLGTAHLARDFVQRLAGIGLQLGKDFPVKIVNPVRHSREPHFGGTPFHWAGISEQMSLLARVSGGNTGKSPIFTP